MTKRRVVGLVLLVATLGLGLWLALGGANRMAQERITQGLVDKGLPPEMARCIGSGLGERLSLPQIAKLERIAPQEGEAEVPLSVPALLQRLRRVDDPQVVEAAMAVSARCALAIGL